MKIRRYEAGAPDTPAVLRCCFEAGSLPAVTSTGNLDLLDRRLIGFFCSVRCPGDAILKTYDLARTLRNTDVTLIGGFQSPMEKDFLDLVLRGPSSVVVCPARGLGNMRIPKGWKNPLAEGRLLLLSFFDDNIRRPTADIAAKRNAHVASPRQPPPHRPRRKRQQDREAMQRRPRPKANQYSPRTPLTMPISCNSAQCRSKLVTQHP